MSLDIITPPLVNPYSIQTFESRIALHPHQMNNQIHNNIYDNLFENLKKKVENKCNSLGYIKQVYEIVNYGDGIIERENLHSIAVFNVTYRANICILLKNTCIILKIDNINDKIMKASNSRIDTAFTNELNGCIQCIINAINPNKFENQDNYNKIIHKKSKKKLQKNDFVKIHVTATKFNALDEHILIFGTIQDLATDEEINEYFDK